MLSKAPEPQHAVLVRNFEDASLFGVMTGSVALHVRGLTKSCASFNHIRRMFKVEIYRRAALQPKVSDTDFVARAIGVSASASQSTLLLFDHVETEVRGDAMEEVERRESFQKIVVVGDDSIYGEISSFFFANDFKSTIMMGIPVAAEAMNNTLMRVLTNLNTQGGIFADAKTGMMVMIEAVAQEVMRLMPMERESPMTNLAAVHAHVPRIVEEMDCCSALVREGIDSAAMPVFIDTIASLASSSICGSFSELWKSEQV